MFLKLHGGWTLVAKPSLCTLCLGPEPGATPALADSLSGLHRVFTDWVRTPRHSLLLARCTRSDTRLRLLLPSAQQQAPSKVVLCLCGDRATCPKLLTKQGPQGLGAAPGLVWFWRLQSACIEDSGLLLRRARNQAPGYVVEFYTMEGEGLIPSTTIRMACSWAIKNGHTGGQFFQALMSQELYIALNENQKPSPVVALWSQSCLRLPVG